MFKSVLSQRVNASVLLLFSLVPSIVFPPCFSPVMLLLKCVFKKKITHDAEPSKLADSGMAHVVFRWRQDRDLLPPLLWSHASAFLCVCVCMCACVRAINTTARVSKCQQHAGTYPHPTAPPSTPGSPTVPQCLRVTSAPADSGCSQVLLKGPAPRLKVETPHRDAKCCLIFVPFWRSLRILALPSFVSCRGLGHVLKKEKPSVHRFYNFIFFF